MPGGLLLNDAIGWTLWSILAIPGAILIWSAFVDAYNGWCWRRAWKRGEIKPRPFIQPHDRAVYR